MKSAARLRLKFARQFHSEEFVAWSRMQPCIVCDRVPTQAAHNPSRAAGGTWRGLSALCPHHHREQHNVGVETFQKVHGFDFKQTNAEHSKKWEAQCSS